MEIVLVGITLLTAKLAEAYCAYANPPTKKCILIGIGSLLFVSLFICAPIAYLIRINKGVLVVEQNIYITLAALLAVFGGVAYRCAIHARD